MSKFYKVYYTVEIKYFSMVRDAFDPEEPEIRSRSAAVAMKRADKIKKEGYQVVATRVVKVTREPVARRDIRKMLKGRVK